MNKTIQINRNLINFGIPILLLAIIVLLLKSALFNNNLSLAITIDLLLTVPLIYLLLIRKSEIPKITVMPVMIAGLIIGSYLLPEESQYYLELFKNWALPIIELLILAFIIFKVSRGIKAYKKLKGINPDFYDTLKDVCQEILPERLISLFAMEVAVIYYGFINWKIRPLQENEFTYHKKSGATALFGALIMVIGVETIALHFLLVNWSPIAAWILSGLSIYTAIQMFGFAKSLSQRPISINENSLILKYGIMNETEILLSDIDKIELTRKFLKEDEPVRKLSLLGELEGHNTIIHLKNENELSSLYGIRKKFKKIALHIDKPEEFKNKINSTLQLSDKE